MARDSRPVGYAYTPNFTWIHLLYHLPGTIRLVSVISQPDGNQWIPLQCTCHQIQFCLINTSLMNEMKSTYSRQPGGTLTQMSIDMVDRSNDVQAMHTRQHWQNCLNFWRPQCHSINIVHNEKNMSSFCNTVCPTCIIQLKWHYTAIKDDVIVRTVLLLWMGWSQSAIRTLCWAAETVTYCVAYSSFFSIPSLQSGAAS